MVSGVLLNIFVHFLYLSIKIVDSHPTISKSFHLGGTYDNPSFRCKFQALKNYLEMDKSRHVPCERFLQNNPENDFDFFIALSFDNQMMKKRHGYNNLEYFGHQTKRSIFEKPHKRGFSMLTRLKLFSNLGQGRGSFNPYWNRNMISTETRALLRPSGSPLRWG